MLERRSRRPAPQFAVVDCETTGLGRHDRIVEIAVITLDPNTWETLDEYDTLINPERDVGPVALHGITASMVQAAPTFAEIGAPLARRLHGAVLIAHNISFDTRMLGYEFARLQVEFDAGFGLCTLRATQEKLGAACRRYGIALDTAHRALADARATAALVRATALTGERRDTTAATVGYLSQSPAPRTLRREGADAGTSEMARIISLAHYPYSDEALLQYLDALDWVLDDHYIDDQEHAAIRELARALGISDRAREDAHRSYLASIIAAAERDGIVTEAEQRLIRQTAAALEVTDVVIPDVTDLPTGSQLRPGMRVCFTGDAPEASRAWLEAHAAFANLQPVSRVTKRGCDLLVAADTSSQSAKAHTARRHGIPVMAVPDFLAEIGEAVR
ncbi:MAG: hypothetical protein F4020_03975 [Gammaproteobacteria bacterium]|nr:hypothetical protein [Gammaproteobacteria bacterium]MYK68727.1 hypothetical protein [Gammaproteobacteria bacterium]